MNNSVNTLLNDFIERAEKSRKYLANTATNFRTPLRLIVPELTEEEQASIELVKKNLDQIFTTLYNKNSSKLSASSIEVYKRRIRNLIADYEKYGSTPSAMANWNRPIITRKLKNDKKDTNFSEKTVETGTAAPYFVTESSLTKHEEALSDGKAIIFTPQTLTKMDIRTLRAYIDYLEKKLPDENKLQIEQPREE